MTIRALFFANLFVCFHLSPNVGVISDTQGNTADVDEVLVKCKNPEENHRTLYGGECRCNKNYWENEADKNQ